MVETMIIEEMPSEEKRFYKENILQEATQEWPQPQFKDAYVYLLLVWDIGVISNSKFRSTFGVDNHYIGVEWSL